MTSIVSKGKTGFRCLIGEWKRLIYKFRFNSLCSTGLNTEKRDTPVIVSLTSYGRRVTETAPFTIYSLLNQSYKPDMIILWLDKDNWNESNLPEKIKKLIDKGLVVKFCDDIRSYKKLIPSLEIYSKEIIITVDDDIIYNRRLVEQLMKSYRLFPKSIHCTTGHKPVFNNEGILCPYNKWEMNINTNPSGLMIPIGCGGILYPPDSLDIEVFNRNNWMNLCPTADDIWFWAMGLKKGTNYKVVGEDTIINYPMDVFYQKLNKGSSLQHTNVDENLNDKQINKVFSYYNLWQKLK